MATVVSNPPWPTHLVLKLLGWQPQTSMATGYLILPWATTAWHARPATRILYRSFWAMVMELFKPSRIIRSMKARMRLPLGISTEMGGWTCASWALPRRITPWGHSCWATATALFRLLWIFTLAVWKAPPDS